MMSFAPPLNQKSHFTHLPGPNAVTQVYIPAVLAPVAGVVGVASLPLEAEPDGDKDLITDSIFSQDCSFHHFQSVRSSSILGDGSTRLP